MFASASFSRISFYYKKEIRANAVFRRGEPFRWDDPSADSGRCAHLRAELDAYYARLYGLTRDELRYVLDPKDAVGGDDFPGESFRVLKEKEVRQYGDATQSDTAVGGTWKSGMRWKARFAG